MSEPGPERSDRWNAPTAEPRIWRLMVEGEPEQRYFDHLMHLINRQPDLAPVDIQSVIGTAPRSYVRSLLRHCDPETSIEADIYCVADVEGDHPHQIRLFEHRLAELRKASEICAGIRFLLAYTNCDFELWIILHKIDFFRTVSRKGQYLKPLQDAFGSVRSIAQYKRQRNFARLLRQISLEDVKAAIGRAEAISRHRRLEGPPFKYCGYTYYRKNPSLSVDLLVREILLTAGMHF